MSKKMGNSGVKFSDSEYVYDVMSSILEREHGIIGKKGHLWIVSFDSSGKISNIELVFIGEKSLSEVKASDIYQVAIQKAAKAVVIVQNRQDYTIIPSEEEINFAGTMIQVGKIIDLEIIDYLIISLKNYYSFKDEGLIDKLSVSEDFRPADSEKSRLKKQSDEISKDMDEFREKQKGKYKGALEIAKEMLENREPVGKILKYTGLSQSQVEDLKNN